MATEVVYFVSDSGDRLWFDNAEHELHYSCDDFDVYLSSNARQTAYIILEWPVDHDMVIKITNHNFKDMTTYALDRHIRWELPKVLETLK